MKNIVKLKLLVLSLFISFPVVALEISKVNSGDAIQASLLNKNFIELRDGASKNYIINGNFDFWQRKTSGSSEYVADRFYCLGDCSRTNSNISTSKYFINISNSLEQRLESNNLLELDGETVTLSFYSSNPNPQVLIKNPTSIDSGYSTSTESGINASTSNESNYFYYTFTVNSTMAQNGFAIRLVGAGNYGQIMLTKGEDPIKFKRAGNNYQDELNLCLRYFEKTYRLSDNIGKTTNSGSFKYRAINTTSHFKTFQFKQVKRNTPNMTPYSARSGASNKIDNDSDNSDVSASFGGTTDMNTGYLTWSATSGKAYLIHWTADSEIY